MLLPYSYFKIAFDGCLSFLNVNGHVSAPVYLGIGLHQGSSLSPKRFVLVALTTCLHVSVKLESNQSMRVFIVNVVNPLLILLAEDSNMFLEATVTSWTMLSKKVEALA